MIYRVSQTQVHAQREMIGEVQTNKKLYGKGGGLSLTPEEISAKAFLKKLSCLLLVKHVKLQRKIFVQNLFKLSKLENYFCLAKSKQSKFF